MKGYTGYMLPPGTGNKSTILFYPAGKKDVPVSFWLYVPLVSFAMYLVNVMH